MRKKFILSADMSTKGGGEQPPILKKISFFFKREKYAEYILKHQNMYFVFFIFNRKLEEHSLIAWKDFVPSLFWTK